MTPRSLARRHPNRSAFAGVFAATLMCFLAVGAVLPVLPRYVTGPLGAGDVAVGIVTGAFAATAIVGRPIGGRIADRRGRRLVVLSGLALTAAAGLLYFLPFGVGGLIVARLVLGVGDGWVFTAGLAWAVDLAPQDRRGQTIAMYGLGVWGGLSFGPLIGEGLFHAAGYDLVWAFAAASPLAGALIARAVPDRRPVAVTGDRVPFLPRAALPPGIALMLANIGYAALAGFIVLHLDEIGAGHGAAVFTAFAITVVAARLLLSWLPDRAGPRVSVAIAATAQSVGLALIAAAGGLTLAVAGALVMGAGFSLSFPSLALLVVERVDERSRGAAMGAFTAFFDVGVGLGAPLAGAISALAGYPAAFAVGAACAAAGGVVAVSRSASGR
ncbi:MAG TPA: MFS transporter [Solirubrobacteraceae bacterium]|nr:MFS transporter [Solirubrobacteraceae bacterium]